MYKEIVARRLNQGDYKAITLLNIKFDAGDKEGHLLFNSQNMKYWTPDELFNLIFPLLPELLKEGSVLGYPYFEDHKEKALHYILALNKGLADLSDKYHKHRIKGNKSLNLVLNIIFCILILILFVLIHEFSHIIVAILSGNDVHEINISLIRILLNIFGLNGDISVTIVIKVQESVPLISIVGSLGVILFCVVVIMISYKISNLYLLTTAFLKILIEVIDWLKSPFINQGDAYVFYDYYKITTFIIPSIFLVGLIFFFLFSFLSIYKKTFHFDIYYH